MRGCVNRRSHGKDTIRNWKKANCENTAVRTVKKKKPLLTFGATEEIGLFKNTYSHKGGVCSAENGMEFGREL